MNVHIRDEALWLCLEKLSLVLYYKLYLHSIPRYLFENVPISADQFQVSPTSLAPFLITTAV